MFVQRQVKRARGLYQEYPKQFWVLLVGVFIDRLGGGLLFPFFTLYITSKFGVGMTQVGVIFAIYSLTSVVGSMFGGALSDRMGRKGMLLFGLVVSALSSLWMGVLDSFPIFILSAVVVGLLGNVGGPAQQALVADLLPPEKRTEGFGMLRVVVNLSITIGPLIGGLLASQSYLWLFICDAVASLITAGIIYLALPETRPAPEEGAEQESIGQTFRGYFDVAKDTAFLWFLGASVLMVLVYMQMNSTLAVYLRDSHGIAEQGFGYLLSMNAAMVVLLQFPITRWVNRFRPVLIMAVGTLLYAIGFGLYGFVSSYALFILAMVILTVGEMFVSPVGQAIVARLAPEEMRGRYMAVFGFSWVIPSAIGPLLAGLVMDNADPRWVWYAAGIIGLVAAAAFYQLERMVGGSTWSAIEQRLDILEQLESKAISAAEAATLLEGVAEGKWASLQEARGRLARRHLRVRVSEMGSGIIKHDLQLPLGLVNTVLYEGGSLVAGLEGLDHQALHDLLAAKGAGGGAATTRSPHGDHEVELSVQEPDDGSQA